MRWDNIANPPPPGDKVRVKLIANLLQTLQNIPKCLSVSSAYYYYVNTVLSDDIGAKTAVVGLTCVW